MVNPLHQSAFVWVESTKIIIMIVTTLILIVMINIIINLVVLDLIKHRASIPAG